VVSDQVLGQDATANGTAQAGSDDLAKSGVLFAPLSAAGEARRAGVMTVMDDINRRWGRGTLRTLAEGWASRGACAGSGCRRLIRRGGGSCWGWGEGGNRLAGRTWRGGLGELLGIVREERDVAATGRHFQSRPVENADVTPYIVDQAALLERTPRRG
jgi:hypothetical protein